MNISVSLCTVCHLISVLYLSDSAAGPNLVLLFNGLVANR